ncbi:MAG: tetratricopeptide repeat protein [Gammaproteobacteria bacterium]|nr:MAG: tetratricopeptide repeat protein [Gammaproteobacteria bacterium]
MLASGQDNALLRFSLGNEYLKAGEWETAAEHLARAVEFDEEYSAAWRQLGQALAESLDHDGARAAWTEGVAAAKRKGDIQAARQMGVYLRRLDKKTAGKN